MNIDTTTSQMLLHTALPLAAIAIQLALLFVIGFQIGRNGESRSRVIIACVLLGIVIHGAVLVAGRLHW